MFSYRERALHFRAVLQQKPFKPDELIVRWNRFLLNNEVDLNIRTLGFIEYYCLDIIVPALSIVVFCVGWLIAKLVKLYYWSCFGMATKPTRTRLKTD